MTTYGASPRATPLSAYRTPGVRLEWLDAAPQSRTLLRTDIAGFAGIAERGPLHRPVRVDSWEGFRGVFGEHRPDAYLAYAVEGFYANGGRRCWVVRVADPVRAASAVTTLNDTDGHPVLTLTATSPGNWGNRVRYRVEPTPTGLYTLTLRLGEVTEVWRNLASNPRVPNSRDPVVLLKDSTAGSRLVTADAPAGASSASPGADESWLAGGTEGLETLEPKHFLDDSHIWGLSALDKVDEVALVAAPDLWVRPVTVTRHPRPRPPRCDVLSAGSDQGPNPPPAEPAKRTEFSPDDIAELQRALLDGCQRRADRVALLDSPQDPLTNPADALRWRSQFDSAFGALYYPWPLVVDPLSVSAEVVAVPPCGHLAGVCARVDLQTGVHKPPANEVLALAVDTAFAVGDVAHGDLNDNGVNAIRADRGIRVLGDRTLTVNLPEWQYLNVRRLVLALEEQIVTDTAWTVFEPNSIRLWREVDRVVRGVLEQAWLRGMLTGATRAQAYTVTCDASVNPPSEVAAGRLVCVIGLNPPPPAEFVVLRVIRTPSGVSVIEQAGGG